MHELSVRTGAVVTLSGRLLGGAASPVSLTIKPRIQKDKWSLYWKVKPYDISFASQKGLMVRN